MLRIDELILVALNALFENEGFASIHDTVNEVNGLLQDVSISYNDVVSVADRCMSLVYNDTLQSVELV
jgi:hypothetical protein